MHLVEQDQQKLLQQASYFIAGKGKLEWEMAFGRDKRPQTYYGAINKGIFQSLIRRLKALPQIKSVQTSETLDISVSKGGTRGENFPIRLTLEGRTDVMAFCREDPDLINQFKLTYKSRDIPGVKRQESTLDITDYGLRANLKAEESLTWETTGGTEAVRQKDLLLEYLNREGLYGVPKTFRYKQRYSFYTEDHFRFDLTVVKSSPVNTRVTSGRESGARLIQTSQPTRTIKEANLLNQRETFEIEVECVSPEALIDTSELEEGELPDSFDVANTPENQKQLTELLIRNIGIVLQLQSNGLYVTPFSEAETVRQEYTSLVKGVVSKIVQQKTQTTEEDRPHLDGLKNLTAYLQDKKITYEHPSRVVEQMESGEYQPPRFIHPREPTFIGPKPVSLDMRNIQSVPGGINILEYYSVTDKADGEGNLLYINSTGQGYLIDSNLNVRHTGLHCPTEAGTLLNGEYITRTLGGSFTFRFYAYDIYFRQGRNTSQLPLCYPESWKKSTKKHPACPVSSRLQEMQEACKELADNSATDQLQVSCKTFYYAGSMSHPESTSIFELSRDCWQNFALGNSPYKYDGLIYTPMLLPVAYEPKDPDYDLFRGKTWFWNFKWKPPQENTIDFYVETEQQEVYRKGKTVINRDRIITDTTITDEAQTITRKYKNLYLYVGGTSGPSNPCQKTSQNLEGLYTKRLFQPTLPADPNAHQARIPLENGKMIGGDDRNLIESGTVVEFEYRHPSHRDDMYYWVPKRTRYDKTFSLHQSNEYRQTIYRWLEYAVNRGDASFVQSQASLWKRLKIQRGKIGFDFQRRVITGAKRLTINNYLQLVDFYSRSKNRNKKLLHDYLRSNFNRVIESADSLPINANYGNNQTTANNVWRTIHHPITVAMITTGKDIPTLEAEEEVYYDTPAGQRRSSSSTIGLQRYHNFIKRFGLLKPAAHDFTSQPDRATILDLACGKGGDLPKWKDLSTTCVVGMDIARDNLENPNDGACARYNEMKQIASARGEKYPLVYFFQADARENVVSEIKNRNDTSTDLFRHLWYDLKGDKPGYFPAFSYADNRFGIVSLQFALHYFWESNTSLSNLINNVSSNLREDGLFVGCCFNGERVMKLLEGQDSVEASKGDRLLWRITKRYTESEMPSGDKSVGMPIEVFMSSINRTHREYLVNFRYLKSLLERVPHQLTPLTPEEAKEVGLPKCYDSTRGTASFQDISDELSTMKGKKKGSWNLSAKDRDNALRSIAQMSPAERQISYLNDMFVFKKRG